MLSKTKRPLSPYRGPSRAVKMLCVKDLHYIISMYFLSWLKQRAVRLEAFHSLCEGCSVSVCQEILSCKVVALPVSTSGGVVLRLGFKIGHVDMG